MTDAEAELVFCDPTRRADGLAAARAAIDFLRTTEARDEPEARRRVGPGFAPRFPRGRHYDSLETWLAASRQSYKFMRKKFDRIDVALIGEAHAVVYCYGSLHGEYLDGRTVNGTRFIDRFEVRNGLICEQDVWNDLV
jgi:hypothetical protein